MAEITSELITSARDWLRIATESRDDEIGQTIEACLIDLSIGGVVVIDTSDSAIQQCIKLYLKAQFGYDSNAEKFAKGYEFMKQALALCGDYNEEEAEDGANG